MKPRRQPHRVAFCKDDCGQVLPLVAIFMVVLLGFAGLVIDIGHAYFCYRELQASCDAAALAGAQALPAKTATSVATTYSSVISNQNKYGNMTGVTMVSGYPLIKCLKTLQAQGIACTSPANGNAMAVKQQYIVPMYFAKLFGLNTMTVVASATASMRGANPSPYNIAIIVDATPSMNSIDSDSNCNTTRIACALNGVQTLLAGLSPCGINQTSCGAVDSSGQVANSVDRVSLFAFPNVTTASVGNDYDCNASQPTSMPYSYPTATATSYSPSNYNNATYQVLNYASDYRSSDTATSLNTGSNLSISVGGKPGCTGLQTPGSEDTYFAGVIYAAQASLMAEQVLYPGSKNVLIMLSDGDSNAPTSKFAAGTLTSTGVYPSAISQCHQAVTAGQAATKAGTTVYSISYGANASGCSTDKVAITPCQTMQGIASSTATFYSDYTATQADSSCISASQPTTNLNQIFTQILGSLTQARLILDSTT